MQELIHQLETLKRKNNFNNKSILEIASIEQLRFLITEAVMSEEADYSNLYDLFDLLRDRTFEKGGINVFEEYLTLKIVYFREVYNLPSIILEALMVLIGPVRLDFELEKNHLKDDEFYSFFIKRYEDFKRNNELTILKMLNMYNMEDLKADQEQLQGAIEQLKKYVDDSKS